MTVLYIVTKEYAMIIYKNINYPQKINFPLAFGPDKCNNGCARFLVARRRADR